MTLASHMGEYFGKTLVKELRGYEKCRVTIISCWNRLYWGTHAPAGILPAVPAFGSWRSSGHCRPHEWECSPCGGSSGKTLVSWEIEVKPIVHGRGVDGRFGLAWTNVDFRELVGNGKLLGEDDPCQPHGLIFWENSGLGATGVLKVSGKDNFMLESPI